MSKLRPYKDLVVKTGEYTNQAGETKGRYLNVGTLFLREDKSITIKLESIPVGFDGWIGAFDIKAKNKPQPAAPKQAPPPPPAPMQMDDDDLPF